MGTGIGKIGFQDLEVLNNEKGAPYFSKSPFSGNVWLSISHTEQFVTASVILEEIMKLVHIDQPRPLLI